MRPHIVLLILLTLLSLSLRLYKQVDFGDVPLEAVSYYNDFVEVVGDRYTSYGQMSMSDHLPPMAIAMCTTFPFRPWKLEISRFYWNKLTQGDRRSTMYHELTHCLFHLKHVEDNPLSYMSPDLYPGIPRDVLEYQVLITTHAHDG